MKKNRWLVGRTGHIYKNIESYTSGVIPLSNDKNKSLFTDNTKGSGKPSTTYNDPLRIVESDSNEVDSLEDFVLSLAMMVASVRGVSKQIQSGF